MRSALLNTGQAYPTDRAELLCHSGALPPWSRPCHPGAGSPTRNISTLLAGTEKATSSLNGSRYRAAEPVRCLNPALQEPASGQVAACRQNPRADIKLQDGPLGDTALSRDLSQQSLQITSALEPWPLFQEPFLPSPCSSRRLPLQCHSSPAADICLPPHIPSPMAGHSSSVGYLKPLQFTWEC